MPLCPQSQHGGWPWQVHHDVCSMTAQLRDLSKLKKLQNTFKDGHDCVLLTFEGNAVPCTTTIIFYPEVFLVRETAEPERSHFISAVVQTVFSFWRTRVLSQNDFTLIPLFASSGLYILFNLSKTKFPFYKMEE